MKSKNSSRFAGILILLIATTVAVCQTESQQGPPSPPFGGQPPNLADIGKNVVVGQLKKIENKKLTIAKPDGVEQAVTVDDNTKFFGDHRDAIKLEDYKIGDKVAATGTLKDGVFVASQLAEIPPAPEAPPLPPLPN